MLSGDVFSPAEFARQTGLVFDAPVEPGQILARGPYKGQPSPKGQASLNARDETPSPEKLALLLDKLLPHSDKLHQLGVEEIVVYIGYYWRDQCNLSFTPEELNRLAQLGVRFWISCYEEPEA